MKAKNIIRVNKKFEVDIDNIVFVYEGPSKALVYVKKGYPKVLKSDCSYREFLQRLVNMGLNSEQLQRIMK